MPRQADKLTMTSLVLAPSPRLGRLELRFLKEMASHYISQNVFVEKNPTD
jgi:hypothetical protein